MLEKLKFVQGAIAKKGLVPELTHFEIKEGKVTGCNGHLTLSCPFPLDIDARPKALPFIKAIEACKGVTALHMTKAGRLAIKSGKFKAFIECLDDGFPVNEPEGEIIELTTPILPIIKKLAPFIAEDASRGWARGILFDKDSVFATNNICLVEHFLATPFPVKVNVPQPTIKELLRIKLEPEKIQVTKNSITFHFEDGRWLKSQLYNTEWPDLTKILNMENNPKPVVPEMFDEIERLLPFLDELQHIYFKGAHMTTSATEESGAAVELDGLPEEGVFQAKQLLLLKDLVDKIDFSTYPRPCIFYGGSGKNALRGAIIGMNA